MALVETEAVVLRSFNLAEADKIVVCLTRQAGVVRAVAQGARRLKSRFGAGLEPFTIVQMGYYEKEGRELVSLRHLEIISSSFGLAESAEAVAMLHYLSELVLEFAPPHEPNERLYRMVTATIGAIKRRPQALQPLVRYFEIWTLRLSGFLPDPRSCADCSRRFVEGEGAHVNAEGRLRCNGCGVQALGTNLSAEALSLLRAAQRLSPDDFARNASARSMEELREISGRLIERALERPPRVAASFKG